MGIYFLLKFSNQMELLNSKKCFFFSLNTMISFLTLEAPRNKILDPPEKTGQ